MSRSIILVSTVLLAMAAASAPSASQQGPLPGPGTTVRQQHLTIEDDEVNACNGESVHLAGDVHVVITEHDAVRDAHVNGHLTGMGSFGNEYLMNLQARAERPGGRRELRARHPAAPHQQGRRAEPADHGDRRGRSALDLHRRRLPRLTAATSPSLGEPASPPPTIVPAHLRGGSVSHLPTGPVHHIRMAVTDVERSKSFYTEVLGFGVAVDAPPPAEDEHHDALWSIPSKVASSSCTRGCSSGSARSTRNGPPARIGSTPCGLGSTTSASACRPSRPRCGGPPARRARGGARADPRPRPVRPVVPGVLRPRWHRVGAHRTDLRPRLIDRASSHLLLIPRDWRSTG